MYGNMSEEDRHYYWLCDKWESIMTSIANHKESIESIKRSYERIPLIEKMIIQLKLEADEVQKLIRAENTRIDKEECHAPIA